jgi:hypothetical protein
LMMRELGPLAGMAAQAESVMAMQAAPVIRDRNNTFFMIVSANYIRRETGVNTIGDGYAATGRADQENVPDGGACPLGRRRTRKRVSQCGAAGLDQV